MGLNKTGKSAMRDLIQFSIDYGKSFKIGLEPAAQFP